jgi:hypothetical protein
MLQFVRNNKIPLSTNLNTSYFTILSYVLQFSNEKLWVFNIIEISNYQSKNKCNYYWRKIII